MSSMGWWATRFTPRAAWWCGGKATHPPLRAPGTGNYNPTTAKLYTDLGLLTCRPEFGEDVTNFFNLLTGICQFQSLRKLVAAPFELHDRLLAWSSAKRDNARQGLPARIILKLNSLADRQVIEALYRASAAGVKVDLIVRGICCLRPGLRA